MSDAAVIAADHVRRSLGVGGPDRNSVPALWETARYLMRWLIAVCGDPCALAAGGWLSPKERRGVVFWLRPVEAIVRRLLVAEAARIAKAPPATKSAGRQDKRPAARPSFCRVAFPDPGNSTGWAVRFSVLPAPARPAAGRTRHLPRLRNFGDDAAVLAPARLALSAALYRQRRVDSSLQYADERRPKASRAAGSPWPLARRVEAVLRVLANPQSYVRRLARRLLNGAARLARVCQPPPPPEPGERPPLGGEALRHASDHALRALSEVSDR